MSIEVNPPSMAAGRAGADLPDPAASDQGSTGMRPLRVLLAALTGVFVSSFPAVILVASLPEVASDLGTSEGTIAWVITAPILVSSVLLPMLGRIGDTIGHRRLFLIGLSTAAVSAALCAFSWNVASLIAFRSISQAAGTACHPAAIALLMATYKGKARNTSLGYWAFVAAGSPALGLAFGGPLVGATGWRAIFVVQAVMALGGVIFARYGLRETPRRPAVSLDVAGGVVLMAAVGALLLALDRGRHWGWASPAILACALVFVLAGIGFVCVERQSRDPMLPLALVRDRAFAVPIVAESLAQASNMGAFFIIPFILHREFDQGAGGTALLMLPLPLGMAAFSPLGGRLSWSLGSRRTGLLGSSLLSISVLGMMLGASWRSLPIFLISLVVQGAANGLLRPANSAALSLVLTDATMGVGMATLRMTSQVGTALGITVAVATSTPDSSTSALWAAVVIGGLAFAVSTQLTGQRGGESPERDAAIATTVASLDS